MKKGYIGIIDSGIGGLSLLKEMIKIMPNERYVYLGDNDNSPYGTRTSADLLSITMDNLELFKEYDIKALAFGCNTLSMSVLNKVKKYYPEGNFFGVYPPVEINLIRKRKTLLMCTPVTASNYSAQDCLDVLVLPSLAKTIERNMFNLCGFDFSSYLKRNLSRKDWCEKFFLTTEHGVLTTNKIKKIINCAIPYYSAVILGCTHYNFIKNQIFNHFQPQLLLGGESFTAKRVKKHLIKAKTLEKFCEFRVEFIGKSKNLNKIFFEKILFNL